ncbi:hypothetical protein PPL_08799 [Heterostelium album PN500]|uniref:EGF-like domain-containing protein n=1 Tax=Heterostelium pallidum (strain ATCC 26659 / Pp 5 / PN500) TaxID=670386 RepID=D3BJR9_HETP5|nr:hypothetical protein PPL_08799 [Heterostelium album PN500]EFA78149.1 hypothetical protein PPL_08799 [Heterostelium album PN500]|eukprot:XP_020430275.1 hypothetical protein PPL_08799 [Heterostelium album PN500]
MRPVHVLTNNPVFQLDLAPYPTSDIVAPVSIVIIGGGSQSITIPFSPTTAAAPSVQIPFPDKTVLSIRDKAATIGSTVLVQGGDQIRIFINYGPRRYLSRFVPLLGTESSIFGMLSIPYPNYNSTYSVYSQNSNRLYKTFNYVVSDAPPSLGSFDILSKNDLPLFANWATYSYTSYIPNLKFSKKPLPDYPFGFISQTKFSFQMLFPPYKSSNSIPISAFHDLAFESQEINFGSWPTPMPTSGMPFIKSLGFTMIDSYTAIVNLEIESVAGYYKTTLQNGIVLNNTDLVEGDFYNGRYESLIRMPVITENPIATETYTVYDITLQASHYLQGTPYAVNQPLVLPLPFFSMNPFDIDSFEFRPNNIDVTNGPANTTLYFSCKGVKDGNPKIQILQRNYYAKSEADLNIFEGHYDPVQSLFVIPITLRQSLFSGPVEYLLWNYPASFTPSSLASLPNINQNAYLKVISTYADLMGPIVSDFRRTSGPAVITEQVLVNWTFTINDQSGFKNGFFYITSDENPNYLVRWPLFYESRISGDQFQSTHRVSLMLSRQSTKFKAKISLELYDYLGNLATSLPSWTNDDIYINPFVSLLNSPTQMNDLIVQYDNPEVANATQAVIRQFYMPAMNVDVSGNRFANFSFEIQYFNPIMTGYPLKVYFTTIEGDFYVSTPSYVQMGNNLNRYFVNEQLPYGFGANGGILISIYGAIDSMQVITGFSSKALKDMSLPYFLTTTFNVSTASPIIESTSPMTTSGGLLTIYGRLLGSLTDNTTAFVSLGGVQNSTAKLVSSSSRVVIIEVEPNSGAYLIVQLKYKNKLSNSFYVWFKGIVPPDIVPTPTPTPTTPSNKPCSDCSSTNGRCEDGVCICTPPYSGYNCRSQIINTTTTHDPSNPTTVTTGFDFTAGVSVVELREIDTNGAIVERYNLTSWILTNRTESSYQAYRYSTTIDSKPVNATIQTDVYYYSERSQVKFGSKNLTMDPFTLKYTITVATYPFKDRLNYLQVILSANINPTNSDSCSSQEADPSQELTWIKLRVNDKSLYGRFIDTAIIDGIETKVRNTLLNANATDGGAESADHTNVYFVGINIPNFQTVAMLDPDFSVLLDDNSVCKSTGLTTLQKIGIIIGSVLGFIILATILVFIIKRKYGYKIKMMMEERKNQKSVELD